MEPTPTTTSPAEDAEPVVVDQQPDDAARNRWREKSANLKAADDDAAQEQAAEGRARWREKMSSIEP